jgi:apolipoprotein N-acyltransferase
MSKALGFRAHLATPLQIARVQLPTTHEISLAILSAALLVLSFPDFNLWPLAWIALVPLLVAAARGSRMRPARAFILGWITGTLFFYGSCYWLTYAMIRYGFIPTPIAYLLLVPVVLIVGLFPATCCALMARAIARWGSRALFLAPILWATLEWARLSITGQLWNAIGYSQAYTPVLIQTARWGGVYAVGFLIVMTNAALAYLLIQRTLRAFVLTMLVIPGVFAVALLPNLLDQLANPPRSGIEMTKTRAAAAVVVAVQPNVPMESAQSLAQSAVLLERHLSLSEQALRELENKSADAVNPPRIVTWPESPMNFTYTRDAELREVIARFALAHHTSVLFNSLEPAPANGAYNAAVMVNEEGRLIAQYDKIRLLPFGEYIPLPRWLPGVDLIPVMVGDFTPGAEYPLIPFGREARAGVFICFESAFPAIARNFAQGGADVLINISNDGYLGPTPVMRQHLANVVFRAVENDRPVLRVTNTGISAYITNHGWVLDATTGFQIATRTWAVGRANGSKTFYTEYGDLFVRTCVALSLLVLALTWRRRLR